MGENNEKAVNTVKEVRGVPFKKGDDPRRNLAGKPPGTKNFETDFDEAVDEIAKENKMTRSEARKLLLKVAFKQAKDGNYSFYKDIHDRIYGQASQKIDTENKNVNVNLVIEDKDKIKNVIRDQSANN